MTDRQDSEGELPGGRTDQFAVGSVVATPAQLFGGFRLGEPSSTVCCSECDSRLCEGDEVVVTAQRSLPTPRWAVVDCRCSDCWGATAEPPASSVTQVRLRGRLGVVTDVATQDHWSCLLDPTVATISGLSDVA